MRLIGDSGEQLGVMTLHDARQIAEEKGTDIVEVSPGVEPPVCRLMDYGKFKYEQAKKDRQSSKSQKSSGLREVRMRPKIGQHDIDFKMKSAKRLLAEGAKVKLIVLFRGREIVHPSIGRELLEKAIELLGESAKMERGIMMEGRSMTVILTPGKQPKVKKEEKEEKNAQTENE